MGAFVIKKNCRGNNRYLGHKLLIQGQDNTCDGFAVFKPCTSDLIHGYPVIKCFKVALVFSITIEH